MDQPQQIAPRFWNWLMSDACGGNLFPAITPGNATWVAANRAMYVPFALPVPFNVKRLCVINGATVSGNFDVGIFGMDGVKILSSGATAQSGASSVQWVGSFDVVLPPGSYYYAMSADNTTATYYRQSLNAPDATEAGGFQEASAYPLPATMTPVIPATGYHPFVGMTSHASGF